MSKEEKESIGRTLIELIESLPMVDDWIYGSEFVAGATYRQCQIIKIIQENTLGGGSNG